MIPARLEPFVFALILSGFMSLIITGISTLRTAGMIEGFPELWAGAWLPSWLVAFPVVLVIAPLTRRIVRRLLKS